MSDRTITVGGLPGTGTSTLCRLLQERTGLPYTYAGKLFRDAAAQRGMSLADFGALAQVDDRVDRELDETQKNLLHGEPLILEGRLAGWLAFQEQVPALKVWITCRSEDRVRRVAERDDESPTSALAGMLEREASEADRYRRYYGLDLSDMRPYDMVLDSTDASPEDLAAAVIAAWETPAEVPN